jgi:hypothetical protein
MPSAPSVLVVMLAVGSAACRGRGTTVAVATEQEFIREISVVINDKTHTWEGLFRVRPGVRVPIEGFWLRYAPFLGIPPSALVLARPPMRDSVLRDGMLYAFQQVHRGYPVSNGGYLVDVVNGYVVGGAGKAMIGLPDQLPPPISADRALAIALAQVEPKGARPWLTEPGRWRPPASTLALAADKFEPIGSDFHLVYTFSFSSTGVMEPGTLTIDAVTGAVITRTSGSIR